MKKQLMIALLSITPALGVVAQDKLYKISSRWATSPFWTDH